MGSFRKILIYILTVTLVFTFSSCKKSREEERKEALKELYGENAQVTASDSEDSVKETGKFSLAYSSEDSLNPYKCQTNINKTVCRLMYDSLVHINGKFEAEYVMADEITVEGDLITVTILPALTFSDGTSVTTYDIVYSCNVARVEGSNYREQLSLIKEVSHSDNKVYIRLKKEDSLAINLLDFPIIKRQSDTVAGVAPIGSGRYKLVSDDELGTYLSANKNWFNASALTIPRVLLVRMPSVESIMYSVEIGTLSFYYSELNSGEYQKNRAQTIFVDLNNLVFLGVNQNYSSLSDIRLRRAISYAVNRDEISTKAYSGRAVSATGPITRSYEATAAFQNWEVTAQKASAISELTSLGYSNIDENLIRYDGNGKRVSFSLLVNSENSQRVAAAELIKEQLLDTGIQITIEAVDYETYSARVAQGDYQLYLGEYAVPNNMDITPLVMEDSGYYAGQVSYRTLTAYYEWKNGKGSAGEFINSFTEEMPFIPITYRQGISCYSMSIGGNIISTESDPFYNFTEWIISN